MVQQTSIQGKILGDVVSFCIVARHNYFCLYFFIPETAHDPITFLLIFSLTNIGMACVDLTNFIITSIKVKNGNKVVPYKKEFYKFSKTMRMERSKTWKLIMYS